MYSADRVPHRSASRPRSRSRSRSRLGGRYSEQKRSMSSSRLGSAQRTYSDTSLQSGFAPSANIPPSHGHSRVRTRGDMTPASNSSTDDGKLSSAMSGNGRDSNSNVLTSAGRVKVAVRCRPAFSDEVQNGPLVVSFPHAHPETHVKEGGEVDLAIGPKQSKRRFQYDRAFHDSSTQDDIYNEVGGPIVADVMQGYNGSILAYGQTGTGKTYTMGILNKVTGAHTGIIPRALSHIFGHISQEPQKEWSVTMSFVQIYLETVQDLFSLSLATSIGDGSSITSGTSKGPGRETPFVVSTSSASKPVRERERMTASLAEDSLQVREDPRRGFFVEGLQEYHVKSYGEAIELLNWGLENRVMGYTKMNATSSRSHTILTVNVTQREQANIEGQVVPRTLHGKLMLVDLAGSERVRRTASKGSRLVEARAINQSLSALGNVIAALSNPKISHVPFRDSKLTRLLQGCLGGGASTYLIATVGPASSNESETLSTLMFASRCMSVQSNPVINEEVDYAVLCSRLQAKLSTLESDFLQRERAMEQKYDSQLQTMVQQLRAAQNGQIVQQDHSDTANSLSIQEHEIRLRRTVTQALNEQRQQFEEQLRGVESKKYDTNNHTLRQIYLHACHIYDIYVKAFASFEQEAKVIDSSWRELLLRASQTDEFRTKNVQAMRQHDPLDQPELFGPHLPSRSIAQQYTRTDHLISTDQQMNDSHTQQNSTQFLMKHPEFESFQSEDEVIQYIVSLRSSSEHICQLLSRFVNERIRYADTYKRALSQSEIQQRQREEELTNQSFVLKYLVDTNSQLRHQNRQLRASIDASNNENRNNSVIAQRGGLQEESLVHQHHPQTKTRNSNSDSMYTTDKNSSASPQQISPTVARIISREPEQLRIDQLSLYSQTLNGAAPGHTTGNYQQPLQHTQTSSSNIDVPAPVSDPVKFRHMAQRARERQSDWPAAKTPRAQTSTTTPVKSKSPERSRTSYLMSGRQNENTVIRPGNSSGQSLPLQSTTMVSPSNINASYKPMNPSVPNEIVRRSTGTGIRSASSPQRNLTGNYAPRPTTVQQNTSDFSTKDGSESLSKWSTDASDVGISDYSNYVHASQFSAHGAYDTNMTGNKSAKHNAANHALYASNGHYTAVPSNERDAALPFNGHYSSDHPTSDHVHKYNSVQPPLPFGSHRTSEGHSNNQQFQHTSHRDGDKATQMHSPSQIQSHKNTCTDSMQTTIPPPPAEDTQTDAVDTQDDIVEAIVASRMQNNRLLYKVHWLGTSSSEDEWFLRDDLIEDFPEVVSTYEQSVHRTAS